MSLKNLSSVDKNVTIYILKMTGVRFSKERLPVSQKSGHRCAIPIDFVAISKCKQIPNVKHEELLKLLKLLFP